MDPTKLKEYMDAIGQGLAPALDKIGQNFSTVFTWAMKSNYAQAWVDITWPLLTAVPMYACYKWLKWGFSKKGFEKSSYDFNFDKYEGQMIGALIITIIITVLFLISILVGIPEAIQRFVAPEFSTLQDIIGMLKSAKQ